MTPYVKVAHDVIALGHLVCDAATFFAGTAQQAFLWSPRVALIQ